MPKHEQNGSKNIDNSTKFGHISFEQHSNYLQRKLSYNYDLVLDQNEYTW